MSKTVKELLDEMLERVRCIYADSQSVGPHTEHGGVLYHYTNAAGLLGIIQSGAIWATSLRCLNDPQELRHVVAENIDYLENLCTKRPENTLKVIRAAVEIMNREQSILYPYGIQSAACFSQDGDLLSQWRAYADGGKGFCIGFDSHAVLAIVAEQCSDPNSPTTPNYIPCTMVYEQEQKNLLRNDIVDVVLSYYETLKDYRLNSGDEPERVIGMYLAYCLAFCSMPFKLASFKEEKEVRLTISNIMELAAAKSHIDVKACSRGAEIVTYREVGLRGKNGLLPILRILIGPVADFERTKESLESILRTLGYDESTNTMPELLPSRIALRR